MTTSLTEQTAILAKYLELSQNGKILAEYVWIDAEGNTRSKCRTLSKKPTSVDDLPEWNYDGSSTGQAPGHDSDVYLRPVAFYPDPFRKGDNIIVLNECWNNDGTPNKFNHRHECAKLMKAHASEEVWFGLEQEYTVGLVLVKLLLEMSLKLIIVLVFMLVSTFLVLMPKLCHLNGNSKLVHVKVLKWVINYGLLVIYYKELLKNLPSRFPSIQNL